MRFRIVFLLVTLFCISIVSAAPSPWDSWRSGYTNFEQGEALRERGRYSEAVEKFEEARQNYLAVRSARPDWNQRVIADRLRDCESQLTEIRRLLKTGAKITEPVVEIQIPKTVSTEKEVAKENPSDQTENFVVVEKKKISDAKQEILKLRAEVANVRQELSRQRNFETEISALIRDRRIAEEKLALLEKRYNALLQEHNSPNSAAAELERKLVREKMDSERYRKRVEATEQQLEELQEQFKEAQLRTNAVENALRRAEDELKRKNAEIERVKNIPAVSVAAVDKKNISGDKKNVDQSEFERLAEQYRLTRDELARCEKELTSVKDELRRERSSAQVSAVELTNLRERSQRLEKDVNLYTERIKELQTRLERRESEEFKAATTAKDTRIKLENDLLALQKELVTVRNDFESGKRTLADAERKAKSLDAEILTLRAEKIAAAELRKRVADVEKILRQRENELTALKRDFNALTAENKENRLLAMAAKPKEAELEKAKLRLLELDRLKGELVKLQQLSEELKNAYSKDQKELRILRSKAAEFDTARRRLVELEAVTKELQRLRQLEKELDHIRGRESELAQLKIKISGLENESRRKNSEIAEMQNKRSALEQKLTALKKENQEIAKMRRTNVELQALINNQSAELDSLKQRLIQSGKNTEIDSQRVRQLASQLGPLNDTIQKLQSELAAKEEIFAAKLGEISAKAGNYAKELAFKEKELAELKKLNSELADYKKNSAAELRNKIDISKISRLEDELGALSRLNAELAAERDRLLAEKNQQNSPAPVAVAAKISPEQAASDGVIAESDGNMELAVWHYRQALAIDPEFLPAHLRLGILLFNRGSYADAIPHLSTALAGEPDNLSLALTVARCQLKLQRFGNAKSVIEPLMMRHKNNAAVLMCAALIDAGTGNRAVAEERLIAAGRLAPESAEIKLELARLLADSVTDRKGEAALVYENARLLGAAPEPYLEKQLGTLLDHRREVMRFMHGAANEAEIGKDWQAAVWYYKKLVSEKHLQFVPYLALAQLRAGNISGAKETLEFHPPSRSGMLVAALIALDEKDETAAMRAARQCAGVKIPPQWAAMTAELARLRSQMFPSAAVKVLLQGIN
ncbi:MAG: tetratricopeptide repeat protein [Lentisphaeria bacterium]|nr:tetratricopeptide repeat protein [Lentisphaeria bacterium]